MWRPMTIEVYKRPCKQVREGHTTRGGSASRTFFDLLVLDRYSLSDPTEDLLWL